MYEGVLKSGHVFKPTLNAGVVLANLGDIFKIFVVGVDGELGRQ